MSVDGLDIPAGGGADGRFVCVFNRSRDSYQVPVALHEADLLQALVTDYYAPDRAPSWLPGFLRRKHHRQLPSERTVSDRTAFIVQYAGAVLRLPMERVFRWVDLRLGRTAAKVATQSGAHLYCYHHYLPEHVSNDTCLIVFVFHPLPSFYRQMLADDFALYPEVETSFRLEDRSGLEPHIPFPWTRPDAIVCASKITAQSLIAAGAPEDRIAIIPYGLPEQRASSPPLPDQRPEDQPTRFLFVGNGVQRKGIHHLLRAWGARARLGAELIIVSYELDPAIARLASGDSSVRILGYQSRGELDALFAGSDVFIMPSLLEGFGLVYLEALAAGCHVIATPNTGVPDLGLSVEAATLVEPGDLQAIDAAISAAIAHAAAVGFDRAAIAAEAGRWTQADFRQAIAAHAARTLAKFNDAATGPQPEGVEASAIIA